ncbi:MAG: hypothetical protein ACLFMX_01415 [Halobacteriales archaeon]
MIDPRDDRAQAFTLEALVAGLLVVAALLYAMQAVVVAPGIPGADVEPDIRQQATDAMDIAQREGAISEMVRYYNNSTSEETFAHARGEDTGYGSGVPPTRFGELINQTFHQRGMVVNVDVQYQRPNATSTDTERLIYQGAPPDAATVATTTVTLYSNQTLTGPDGDNVTLAEAASTGAYPIHDVDPGGPLHNVVQVRVVVW